ncbi:MAG: hypothetical protein ACO1QR_03600 [Chthoniobacteraceae bacterium]
MIRKLKRAAIAFALLGLIASVLGYTFRDALARRGKRYVKLATARAAAKYGSALPEVDEVRITRITDQPPAVNKGTKRVWFSDPTLLYVVERKSFRGDEAQEIARLWRAQRLHSRYMAGCFDPHHVLEFRSRGSTVCEAVVCFECGNTTLPMFPIGTVVSFESAGGQEAPEYLQLKELVERLAGVEHPPIRSGR